jgi:tRNA nucleotidyltransferase (CCA-adding enzyme)
MGFIDHDTVADFARERINLPPETAAKHRTQVKGLRERLEKKIAADPSYGLVKMLHAGSVAKGTALSGVNDLDTAVYVKAAEAPAGTDALLVPVARRAALRGQHEHEQRPVVEKRHCVRVNFKGSGLDVDVVPVLYEGGTEDRGFLVANTRATGC